MDLTLEKNRVFAGLRQTASQKKGLTSNERTEVYLIKRHIKVCRENTSVSKWQSPHLCAIHEEASMA